MKLMKNVNVHRMKRVYNPKTFFGKKVLYGAFFKGREPIDIFLVDNEDDIAHLMRMSIHFARAYPELRWLIEK